MDDSLFVSDASFWVPSRLGRSHRWLGHASFVFWLVNSARPRLVVDFGTGPANGYLALCEAIQRCGLDSHSFAVRPKSHVGFEDDDFRDLARLSRLHFSTFSSLIQVNLDEALSHFENRSIDLLHLGGHLTSGEIRHAFDRWAPKMSDRGIVLLDDTNHEQDDCAFPWLIRELSKEYASFEFLHDRGLAVVGIGDRLPPEVDRLLKLPRSATSVGEVRQAYATLGQGLVDRRLRKSLEVLDTDYRGDGAEPAGAQASFGDAYAQNGVLTERVADLSRQLEEISQSLGWRLAQKARHALRLVARDGGFIARCWWNLARLLTRALNGGKSPAVTSHMETWIKQKFRRSQRLGGTNSAAESQQEIAFSGHHVSFQGLPWRRGRKTVRRANGQNARFKVLLVSHDASRSGAPLCMLRLAEQLARDNNMECWIVLDRSGELTADFERVAPTLCVERLAEQGISREEAPDRIAALFREFAGAGVAICNTACVGPFYTACAAHGVPVLAWVHELPTAIDGFCGGKRTVDAIRRSARRIITPADAVGDALASHYRINRDRIHTIYNGLVHEIDTRHRLRDRRRVRKELGIPAEARIVLGCGTIELRKGADLFMQMARTASAGGSTSDTHFIWVGKNNDAGLKCWLDHDIEFTAGQPGRIQFIGPRDNTLPYFLASDVFTLTSREDPCPLVNMEAMASGLPVVAFRDAGGAPELLGGCGVIVPYLDVEAMAKAVVHLLDHGDESKRLGLLAQDKIRSGFTWPEFSERIVKVLETDYEYRPSHPRKYYADGPSNGHVEAVEARAPKGAPRQSMVSGRSR